MTVLWVVDLGSLRLIRKNKRVKQKDLASLLGIASQNYSAMECGRIAISLKNLCKICTILEISPARLLHPIYGKGIEDYDNEWREPFF